jgi:cyclopropane-fatty-acyl-phospholipid synthase
MALMSTITQQQPVAEEYRAEPADSNPYAIRLRNGETHFFGNGSPRFTLVVNSLDQSHRILHGDLYAAARDFVRGGFDIDGDLFAAIRLARTTARRGRSQWLRSALARLGPCRLESWFQTRRRAARNIRFHYDFPIDFYYQFLDSRLNYSCAYFTDPECSLEQAQLAKLDYVCRKLDVRPGERFLDVGCGWGALVAYAAASYGASATGCTLSASQAEYAAKHLSDAGLAGRAHVVEKDYRDIEGRFPKIASVGMFEHVGRRRLRRYFECLFRLLEPSGLLLNHGILRPQSVRDSVESSFLRRHVFPGGELVHLGDAIRVAEQAGFEVLDVENLRPHYALTCRSWVSRLLQNEKRCLRVVGTEIYRTWLLYLAASALSFEEGQTDVYQVLMAKRANPRSRRLTRAYMYDA